MRNHEEITKIKMKMFNVVRSSVTAQQREVAVAYMNFAIKRIKELEAGAK